MKRAFLYLIYFVIPNLVLCQNTQHQWLVDELKRIKNPVDFTFEYKTFSNGNAKYEGWHYLVDANLPDKPGWMLQFPFGTHKMYRRNGQLLSSCFYSINDSLNDTIRDFNKKGICVFMKIYNLKENLSYGASPKNWLYPKVFDVVRYHHKTGNIDYKTKQVGIHFFGPFEAYYSTGVPRVKGTHDIKGRKIGEWTYFKKDGSIDKVEKND